MFTLQIHDPAGPDFDFEATRVEARQIASEYEGSGARIVLIDPAGRIVDEWVA